MTLASGSIGGRRRCPWRSPAGCWGRIAGPAIGALVPDRPVELVGQDIEIGLYPSDIAIAGKKFAVARARAAIATRLTSTAASMTTSAEAQEVEAQLEALTRPRAAGGQPGSDGPVDLVAAGAALAAIDTRLATIEVPHEEWEILYRQRLQVERDLLAGRSPGSVQPTEAGTPLGASVARNEVAQVVSPKRRFAGAVVATVGFGLIAADVVVAALDRGRRRH